MEPCGTVFYEAKEASEVLSYLFGMIAIRHVCVSLCDLLTCASSLVWYIISKLGLAKHIAICSTVTDMNVSHPDAPLD